MNILFKTNEEIKPLISGINASMDIENIQSALEIATEKVINVVGVNLYELAETHYYSDNWELPDFQLLNKLVLYIQKPVANFAFYEHLPFLSVSIGNDSITRREADNEKSAYKYQVDEVRNALLQTAYKQVDNLIKYLNDNAVTFTEWTESPEYIESKKTLFDSYLTFNRIVNIDNSAYFFAMLTSTINEIISENIAPVLDVETLRNELYNNSLSEENTLLLPKIRRYLAYKSFADALIMFSFNMLPAPWKQTFETEMSNDGSTKGNSMIFVREKLSAVFQNKADAYYADIENHIQTRKEVTEPLYTEDYTIEETYNDTDKFVSTL